MEQIIRWIRKKEAASGGPQDSVFTDLWLTEKVFSLQGASAMFKSRVFEKSFSLFLNISVIFPIILCFFPNYQSLGVAHTQSCSILRLCLYMAILKKPYSPQ